MKIVIGFLLGLILISQSFAQTNKKQLSLEMQQGKPIIDGILNDSIWLNAPIATNFIQNIPNAGESSLYKTEVRIAYTNKSLYIGATLYDANPEEIMRQLGQRDEIGQTDYFGISIDPFNDAQTGYNFKVTAANVQVDGRQTNREDLSWDAVWMSNISFTNHGWVVEMEIPYSALRFPKKDIQTWGVNFIRNVQKTRETSHWNAIDPKIQGTLRQYGELLGVANIKPPLRLSFTPYLSGYINHQTENDAYNNSLRGGLDLKYGINEGYTLDMMLIPDFGQVESDDIVLNISPFEIYYQEKRPFFTEGTELFNKGEIFYSRRIGNTPDDYYGADDELNENEEVIENPYQTSLINVTKISGKGKNGFGVGFLNGMSYKTEAVIEDTITREKRMVQTQPFTNYNVTILNQALNNNGYLSFANTNYYQPSNGYMANVSATDFRFETKDGNYAFNGILGLSYVNDKNINDSIGYKYDLTFSKIKGNFRFRFNQRLNSKRFNPNDMGYAYILDQLYTRVSTNYNIYESFGPWLRMQNRIALNQKTLFSTADYIGTDISLNTWNLFHNYLSVNLWSKFDLGNRNDFYESRNSGRVFIKPGEWITSYRWSSDYRKVLAIDQNTIFYKEYNGNEYGYIVGLGPRLRLSDKFNVLFNVNYDMFYNNKGYVDESDDASQIFFGQRDLKTLTNTVNINYIFNHKSALTLKARHYWRTIEYDSFFELDNDGYLQPDNSYTTDNININYFNVDMAYTWYFAPGSEMSLVWKNSINSDAATIARNYFRNVDELFSENQVNSISLKILYYLDYGMVNNWIKG